MKGNVDSVYCEFKYSGVGVVVLLVAAVATLIIVVATPLGVPVRVALGTWIVAMACHAYRGICEVRSLRLGAERAIMIVVAGDRRLSGSLRDGSLVAPWLTIVRWRPEGGTFDRTVVILPDMVAHDDFRRLRVALRWA